MRGAKEWSEGMGRERDDVHYAWVHDAAAPTLRDERLRRIEQINQQTFVVFLYL